MTGDFSQGFDFPPEGIISKILCFFRQIESDIATGEKRVDQTQSSADQYLMGGGNDGLVLLRMKRFHGGDFMVIPSQMGWVTRQPEYLVSPTRVVEGGGQLSGRPTERPAYFKRRGETMQDADFQSVFKRVLDEGSGRR